MAGAKQVMDFRPSKGITTAQSNEHQRRWTENGWKSAIDSGNYDRTREHLNFEIRGGKVCAIDKTKSIPDRMADMLRSMGIKDPNEGLAEPKFRTVVNFIFGGSRARMHELAFGKQHVDLTKGADNSGIKRCKDIEEWAKDVYRFVADKYGEQNIVAFIVHLDEQNPHCHCTLLPLQNGKFAYKKIFAGKDKYEFSARMKALHSEFAEVNRKWGMERGTSISETGAKHRSTEEYRRHLSEECTTIEQSIAAHQRTLADLKVEIAFAIKRAKGLGTMVENLKTQKSEKEKQLADLQRKILSARDNPEVLLEQVRKLESELSDIQKKLDDKEAKLKEADHKLELLKKDMADIEKRTEELRVEAYKYSSDIQHNVNTLMKDVLVEDMVKEYHERMPHLSSETQELFDGSLLDSFSNRGAEVLHCAKLIFFGMIDDATTFAETHGGGGGGSDLKWGRDDEEDNRAWARRCMMMASRMMHPKVARKPKR
jgi:predicted  nucleic acid-binding Zn-ribbon protein